MVDRFPMQGSVAVVTGGSGGIGSAICRRLATAGARVVLTFHQNEDAAQRVLASLAGSGHMLAHARVDDSASLKRLADQVAEKYGKVNLLVNNAGITRAVPHDNLDDLDDDLIDQIFRVNWRGAFAATRAFKSLLMEGDGGVIVNLSSVAAATGLGSNVAYCASKAALDSMTRSLARALAPKIRVVSVAPGWVEGEYAKRMGPAIIKEQEQRTPLKRIAHADDVADAVVAVATALTFSTGCIIPVDGGRPLG
jgi:3-oxoacyl-[acyl-carrier protein] reductase